MLLSALRLDSVFASMSFLSYSQFALNSPILPPTTSSNSSKWACMFSLNTSNASSTLPYNSPVSSLRWMICPASSFASFSVFSSKIAGPCLYISLLCWVMQCLPRLLCRSNQPWDPSIMRSCWSFRWWLALFVPIINATAPNFSWEGGDTLSLHKSCFTYLFMGCCFFTDSLFQRKNAVFNLPKGVAVEILKFWLGKHFQFVLYLVVLVVSVEADVFHS